MASIGELVKEYREQHNLSMAAFAEKCGVSKGYISMIESGVTHRGNPVNLTQDMMSALVRGMNDDFDVMFEKLDPSQKIMVNVDHTSILDKIAKDKKLLTYIEKLYALSDSYKEKVYENIDFQVYNERKNAERNSGSSKLG